MKIAIVHDYIKEYGGAERVLESLHNVFPEAPVFTLVYLPEFLGPHQKRFENWNIKTSWAQYLPFKAKLISPLRLFAPILFKSLDLSDYDCVIVSATGAYSPNTITTRSYKDGNKKAVHLSYVHTPPRYLYGYETARDWKSNVLSRVLGAVLTHILRIFDYKSSQNVDLFVANSEETKKRINKFYRKDAVVIYPPVEVQSSKFKVQSSERDYFLTGGRIARAKHTDLILEAFEKNGLKLKVFGRGFAGIEDELRKKYEKTANIEFVGEVDDSEKVRLMKGAKAFVFASRDEDFGITPVEAMMVGTPVISHRSGGPIETILQGRTGVFFNEFTVKSLNSALHEFEKIKFDRDEIQNYAKKFSKERFEKEIKELVAKAVREGR